MYGLEDENIEISIDKGVLWIKGQKKSVNSRAKQQALTYISMLSNIDENKESETSYEHSIMKIIFTKKTGPKPIKK